MTCPQFEIEVQFLKGAAYRLLVYPVNNTFQLSIIACETVAEKLTLIRNSRRLKSIIQPEDIKPHRALLLID